jgi:hypothetical protein
MFWALPLHHLFYFSTFQAGVSFAGCFGAYCHRDILRRGRDKSVVCHQAWVAAGSPGKGGGAAEGNKMGKNKGD